MSRFTWDERDLKARLLQIEKLLEKETDPQEKAKLLFSRDRLNTLIDDMTRASDSLPFRMKVNSQYSDFLADQRYFSLLEPFDSGIKQNEVLFKDVRQNKFIIRKQINKATNDHVTKTDAISVCYDFYRELDEEMFKAFKRFYDVRFNHLRFRKQREIDLLNNEGSQTYLYGLNESFLEVNGYDNPFMVTTLIHETGHSIDNFLNPESSLYHNYFDEVVTFFVELVSMYKKTGGYDELYYYNHLIVYLNEFACICEDANYFANLMRLYQSNGYKVDSEYYKIARELCPYTKEDIKELLIYDRAIRDITYPNSAALALYFFNIYRHDERKGIEELKKFIRTNDRDIYMPLVLSNEIKQVNEAEIKYLLTKSNECFLRRK